MDILLGKTLPALSIGPSGQAAALGRLVIWDGFTAVSELLCSFANREGLDLTKRKAAITRYFAKTVNTFRVT